MAQLLRPTKRAKKQNLSTVTLGYLNSKHGSFKSKYLKRMRILFDTGCGATLIHHSLVDQQKSKTDKICKWSTTAGRFKTTKTCKINFMLPAFYKHRNVCWMAFVDKTDKLTSQYDMIIGRDLLDIMLINFLFSQNLMEWDGATTPMIDPDRLGTDSIDYLEMEIFYIGDPLTTEAE